MSLEALVEISRHYGKNPDYVLAGGGNTSWKDGKTLYVKGSGISLAEVDPGSFVQMDRDALGLIFGKAYPDDSAAREKAVLQDMLAARKVGEEDKRPSVEALLHDVLPFSFVVHLHPALVNGFTCSRQGEKAAAEIFGDDAIWIPSTNPGYVLSKEVKTAMDAYSARKHRAAAVVFLQNHGIFVGDNSSKGIRAQYGEVMDKIGAWIKRSPDFSGEEIIPIGKIISIEEIISAGEQVAAGVNQAGYMAREIGQTLALLAGVAVFMQSTEINAVVKDSCSFMPVSSAFTPDHIVYAGSDPLFAEAENEAGLKTAWESHVGKTGRAPKIVAVKGLGVFGVAATEKAAHIALDLFKDAVKVAVYSESFGGYSFMPQEQIDFINNWEVERYRASVSA